MHAIVCRVKNVCFPTCIRYVDKDLNVHENCIGLYCINEFPPVLFLLMQTSSKMVNNLWMNEPLYCMSVLNRLCIYIHYVYIH